MPGPASSLRLKSFADLPDVEQPILIPLCINKHVAGKLERNSIIMEEWQPKEDTLVEQSTRFSRDAAAEAKKKLDESLSALFQNSAAASAIQGLQATSRAFEGAT